VLNQQINLYRGVLRPQRNSLPAGGLAIALALTILLVAVVYGVMSWRLDQRQAALADLNNEREQVTEQVAELGRRLDARGVAPELAARAEALARELTIKRRLTALLGGEDRGNVQGFSELLAPLARQHRTGLWLRHIAFRESGRTLAIQGRTTKASEVPAYLQALRSAPAYQGRRFGTFRMRRVTDGRGLGFLVATRCPGEDGDKPAYRVAACLDGGD